MIHTIIRDLDEEEMQTLIKCLGKLDRFSEMAMQSDRRAPVTLFVCRTSKSFGNYNKLFSDENKCIKIEIVIQNVG